MLTAVKSNLVLKSSVEKQFHTPSSNSIGSVNPRSERGVNTQPDLVQARVRAFSDVTTEATRDPFHTPVSSRYQYAVESDSDSLASVAADDVKRSTRFVVLECSQVSTIDATAARGCFLALVFMLEEQGIDLVFAGLPQECVRILLNHGVVSESNQCGDGALTFKNMDSAIEWCENVLCGALYMNPNKSCTLASIFPGCIQQIRSYFQEQEFPPHHTVLKRGDPADALYIVQKGSVAIYDDSDSNELNLTSMFGHIDFFQRKRCYQFTAVTGSQAATHCYMLTRSSYERMARESPSSALAFMQTLYQIISRPKLD